MSNGDALPSVLFVDVWPSIREVVSAFIIPYGDGKAAIVDPGPVSGYPMLKKTLDELGLEAGIVVATHVHIDHSGSAALLLEDYETAVVYVHPRGVKHVIDPERLWNASKGVLGEVADMYGKPSPAPSDRVKPLEDGALIHLDGRRRLRALHTPGHASHHASILLEPEGVLFTGDSAGVILEVGGASVHLPTTPPPLKPSMYLSSLERMITLNPRMLAPTHYGLHKDARKKLEAHYRQMKIWLDTVKEAISSGRSDPQAIAEMLSERDPNVSIVKGTGTYAEKAFIYNTMAGMMDAVMRGEW